MIKRIEYTHVKNRNGDHELAPLTAVVGPNFSGKTALADALRIGLLGHHPALGTTGAATMQLTTEDAMGVTLHTERGKVSRAWMRKGKSVKTSSEGEVAWEPSWLDASAFINATAKERIRLVVGGKAGGADNAIERLGLSPALVKTFDDLEACAKERDEEAKELRVEIKRWEGLLQGAAELAEETPPALPDRGAILARMNKAQAELAEAEAKLRTFREAAERNMKWAAALPTIDQRPTDDHLADLAEKLRTAHEREQATGVKAAELQGKINELNNECRRLRPMEEDAIDEARVEIQEASTLTRVPTGELIILTHDTRGEYDRATAVKERLEADYDNARTAMEDFASLECCPTCKAQAEGWKAAVLETLTLNQDSVALALSQAAEAWRAAAENWKQANDTYEHAQATNARIDAAEQLKARVEEMEHRDRLIGQIMELCDQREQVLQQSNPEEIERLNAEIAEVRGIRDLLASEPPAPEGDPNEMLARIQELQQAVDEIKGQGILADEIWRQHAAHIARKEQAAEARKRLDEASEKLEKATERAKEIRKVVKEEIDALWGKISTIANRLTSEFEQAPITMNAAGEAGYWNGPSWVPFEAMSGSEQLLASTAISIGLQADNDERIVIIDELSRMSHQSKDRFVDALAKLIFNNELDQAILIDHDEKYWLETTAAVKVIRTTE